MRTASSLAGVDRWHFLSSDLVSGTDGHSGCARPESARVETLVQRFAHQAHLAGYGLIVSPMFEDVGVFRRGVGEESEVVTKEMYEFEDKGGRQLALRPRERPRSSGPSCSIDHRCRGRRGTSRRRFRYERPRRDGSGSTTTRRRSPWHRRPRPRRRGESHSWTPTWAQSGFEQSSSGELDGGQRLFAGVPCITRRVLRRSRGRALCRAPELVEKESAAGPRLQASGMSRAARRRPRLSASLCDDCRAHFARVTSGLDALGSLTRGMTFSCGDSTTT